MLEPNTCLFAWKYAWYRHRALFELRYTLALERELCDVDFMELTAFHVGRLTGSHRICNLRLSGQRRLTRPTC